MSKNTKTAVMNLQGLEKLSKAELLDAVGALLVKKAKIKPVVRKARVRPAAASHPDKIAKLAAARDAYFRKMGYGKYRDVQTKVETRKVEKTERNQDKLKALVSQLSKIIAA